MADWKTLARQKREKQQASIPLQWQLKDVRGDVKNSLEYIQTSGLLTIYELSITSVTDAAALLKMISSREVTSTQVIQAYSKRAAIAQQLIGCCTEMFFEEAIERAKKLDEYLEGTGKLVGPLHGLPISIKDSYNVAGKDTTVGT
jgi:amidase